jgi:phosphoglycerate dehydrogenase-like enzyme
MGLDIQGARLGVLGLGGYGTRVAAVGKVFGMEIVAWSQNLTQERCQELGVQGLPRDEFFATSDFITIHLRLSDRVIGLVGETELRSMKPSAFLINTSRGPIVEEAALIRALREGWIAGAALDVFDEEPLPLDHPYRTLDNALLTPHVGYVTPRSYRLFYQDAVDTIAAYLDGKTVRALESAPSDPYWWEGEDVQ